MVVYWHTTYHRRVSKFTSCVKINYSACYSDTAKRARVNLKCWNELLDSLFVLASTLPRQVQSEFSGSRREWKKIRHNLLVRPTDDFDLPEEILGYLQKCRLAWSTLGDALGHTSSETTEKGQRCAYPRCPNATQDSGPEYTCGTCLRAAYCSQRCQARCVLKYSSRYSYF
ncbi:hypothetical protein FRC12_003479 [Ceratobasidium sp. 428]|nr:hypothetical protein FRC12_003479 [Ceratobasidium sp. 428]